MKSFNTYYTNETELIAFIAKHNIDQLLDKASAVLVQIYSGQVDPEVFAEVIQSVKSVLPKAAIIGASTAGEILEGVVSKNSTVLSITVFEKTTLETTLFDKEHFETVDDIARYIAQNQIKSNTKGILLHANLFRYPADELLNAFTENFSHIPVFGGAAGDNMQFEKQYVFTEAGVSTGVAIVLFNSDELHISTDYHLNWQEVGKTFTITKANRNLVYEIDHRPAADVYRQYLGDEIIDNLPISGLEFPMIFDIDGVKVAKVIDRVTEDRGLHILSLVNEGETFKFSYGHVESILKKGKSIVESFRNTPAQTIWLFSCATRISLLQDAAQTELNPFKALPPSIGFFTYGEYYYSNNQNNLLLSETLTIVTLSESSSTIGDTQIQEALNETYNLDFSKQSLIFQGLNHLITKVTDELKEANSEITAQRDEIQTKSKEITDSITYASRIQNAILGNVEEICSHFADAFIFFSPHSIVSGDFYWYSTVEKDGLNYKIIIAADCTGHGVPGAFMTVMGSDFLDDIVNVNKNVHPEVILKKLDEKVTNRLRKSNAEQQVNDGMDIAILCFPEDSNYVYFAGAKNPLLHISGNEINIVRGSRNTIGGETSTNGDEKIFDLHKIEYQQGDKFYIYSDGFQDQFGGPQDRKYLTGNFRSLILKTSDLIMDEQSHSIAKELKEWKGDRKQTDDILIIGIEP